MNSERRPLGAYLAIFRRRAWLILAIVLISVAAAYARIPDAQYRASMQVVVGQEGGVFRPTVGNSAQSFTQTMTALLESNVVAQTVVGRLDLRLTPDQLRQHLNVTMRPDSTVLDVSYDDGSKEAALRVLTEIGDTFTSLVAARLGVPDGSTTGGDAPVTATIFDPPHSEPGRVSTAPAAGLAVGAGLGLFIALALAFALEAFDGRLRHRDEFENTIGAPVVGSLTGSAEKRVIASSSLGRSTPPLGAAADSVRPLAARLAGTVGHDDKRPHLIVVCGVSHDDGASSVGAAMAFALAQLHQRVVCVDADTERPALGALVSRNGGTPGLMDVMEGRADLSAALVRVSVPEKPAVPAGAGVSRDDRGSLRILAGGPGRTPGRDVLGSAKFSALLDRVMRTADVTVVIAPALLPQPDWLALAVGADEVLVVAREGHTRRADADAVREALRESGIEAYGVVVTGSRMRPRYGPVDGWESSVPASH